MKILFIFTGGTIGSTLADDIISIDGGKSYQIIEKYKERYGLLEEYYVVEPYTRLSENATGETLSELVSTVLFYQDKGYDGIIITHGTDTLQYAAAAIAYALGNNCIPTCLIASNYPIEDSRANGLANLAGGIHFIKRQEKGTYVSYQNKGEDIKIHRATRLLVHGVYEDQIYSVQNSYVGSFNSDFTYSKNLYYKERADQIEPLKGSFTKKSDMIYQIMPYPGYNYPLPKILKEMGVEYIVQGTYHSGTIRTEGEEVKEFFGQINQDNIVVFLAGVTEGAVYETTQKYEEFFIHHGLPIAPIAMYIKLWMLASMNLETQVDIEEMMKKSLAGDIITNLE